jgi:hypothetical protein
MNHLLVPPCPQTMSVPLSNLYFVCLKWIWNLANPGDLQKNRQTHLTCLDHDMRGIVTAVGGVEVPRKTC